MLEQFRLDGKVAVVTGASRGLGRTIAVGLAHAGADLVLAARNAEALAETAADVQAAGRRALVVPTDVTQWESVEALAEQTEAAFGRADVLVNNSGVLQEQSVFDLAIDDWHRVINTNLNGVFYGCRAFGPRMAKQGGGSVINMGSAFGEMGVPTLVSYCTSKAAVAQLTRSLAVEWAKHKIRVNCIAPGYMETEMNDNVRGHEAALDRVLKQIPMRRMGQAGELLPVVLFLASAASSYMTGSVVHLDGGMTAR